MRTFISAIIIPLSLLGATVISCAADSSYDRELEQLSKQLDKALVAATEPVHRRYREALEQLLRRATQANDLDAALKIRDAIKAIPGAVQLGKPAPKNAEELAAFLHGTTWEISNGTPDGKVVYTLTFNKDGTFKSSDGRKGALSFLGPRTFKLWNYDPATLNEDLNHFRAQGHQSVYFGKLKL